MAATFPQVCLASASAGSGGLARLAPAIAATSRHGSNEPSAIDTAFESLRIVSALSASSASDWKREHGLIFSSSAVAAAEDYVRTILTDLVEICELSAHRVGSFETRMEFVFSGSVIDAVRAILEKESFSSRENIKTWIKKIAAVDVTRWPSLEVALSEFELVCHIRHSAVHAGGYLAANNARILGVPTGRWLTFQSPTEIEVVVGTVAATIRAMNQALFEGVLRGWLNEGLMKGRWSDDRQDFDALWKAFRSRIDIDSNHSVGDGSLRTNSYGAYRTVQRDFAARAGV